MLWITCTVVIGWSIYLCFWVLKGSCIASSHFHCNDVFKLPEIWLSLAHRLSSWRARVIVRLIGSSQTIHESIFSAQVCWRQRCFEVVFQTLCFYNSLNYLVRVIEIQMRAVFIFVKITELWEYPACYMYWESTEVILTYGFQNGCINKGLIFIAYLHNRAGSQHFLFDVGFTGWTPHSGEEPHCVLCGNRFSSTWLATHDYWLVFLIAAWESSG